MVEKVLTFLYGSYNSRRKNPVVRSYHGDRQPTLRYMIHSRSYHRKFFLVMISVDSNDLSEAGTTNVEAGRNNSNHEHNDTVRRRVDCESMDPEAKSERSDGGGRLMNTLSRTASRISIDPGPPPDGGLEAWTQAFMGHLVVFNTWGFVNSFGVFQVSRNCLLT